jgi:hypothetical protein
MGLLNLVLKVLSEDTLSGIEEKMNDKLESIDYDSDEHTRLYSHHIDVVNEIASRRSGKLPKSEHGWYLSEDDD